MSTAKKLSTVGVLIVALMCSRAFAASPFPADAIDEKTVAVAHVDVAKFDGASLTAAVKAVMGPASTAGELPIKMWEENRQALNKAGVLGFCVVMQIPNELKAGKTRNFAVYVQTKQGTDLEAVQKLFTENMSPDAKASTLFEKKGEYLMMKTKEAVTPKAGKPERAKLYQEGLDNNKEAGLRVVVSLTPEAVQEMQKQVQGMMNNAGGQLPGGLGGGALPNIGDVAPVGKDANGVKWSTITALSGDSPNVTMTMQMADEAGAKNLLESINKGVGQLGQGQGGNPIVGMIAPMLLPLLKPQQKGSQVTLALEGKSVGPLVQMVAPMLGAMGGRGQAQPAPAPAPVAPKKQLDPQQK